MKKILVVDNQDSFVYNLVEMLRMLKVPFDVVKHDELQFPQAIHSVAGVLLSPGGGLPCEYPRMMKLIHLYHHQLPMLGVCLGHQALAQYFGAELAQLPKPLHGHLSHLLLQHRADSLLHLVPHRCAIGRYHSWVVCRNTMPATLKCIATDEDENVMIIRHIHLPIWGVQFHPESVMTDTCGVQILKNWLECLK